MYIVGHTGGSGSGKTTVSTLFANLKVPIIDADVIAHEVTAPHQPASEEIIAHFGEAILAKPHVIDRKKLRDLIFKNKTERQWLERLLHPIISTAIQEKLKTISAPYCIIVIPLLIETGPYPFIQRILVVDVDETTQLTRLKERDHMNEVDAKAMLATQVSRDERLNKADDVIANNSNLVDLSCQVKKLHEAYLSMAH